MTREKRVRLLAGKVIQREMAHCPFGHRLRNIRAVKIAACMARQPRASIPNQQNGDWTSTKATYDFLSHEATSHSKLLAGHIQQTAQRALATGDVLVIQDTTFTQYKRTQRKSDLGPIATTGSSQGLCVHSALVVGWPTKEVLGIVDQQVWIRSPQKRPKETPDTRKRREDRESQKWLCGVEAVSEALGTADERGPRVTNVFDAEGDTFEVLELCQQVEHDYVIRASHNRLLASDHDEMERAYSLDDLKASPLLFKGELAVPRKPARGGKLGQKARTATVEVRSLTVELRPPKNRARAGDNLRTNLIAVQEVNAPTGVEPIEWFLLTSHPVETREQVLEVVAMYQARWLIEEFHMGVKTGCAHEERQLQTAHALKNHLAFATVVAWQLLRLRDLARRETSASALKVLTPEQLEVLRALQPKMPKEPTAREALRWVAKLGGFLGRKSDGEPGWRTLWSGFEQLLMAERGYLAALQKSQSTGSSRDLLR